MPDLPLDDALARLKSTFPTGRFFARTRIDAGKLDEQLETGAFEIVRLFDYRLGTSFRRIGGWSLVVNNLFISAAVNGILTSWLWHQGGSKFGRAALQASIKSSYKHFFAQCILGERNCYVGRSLFLEGILFEQDLHRPALEEIASNPAFGRFAAGVHTDIPMITAMHEFGHYLKGSFNFSSAQFSSRYCGKAIAGIVRDLESGGDHRLAEELACDAFALTQIVLGPLPGLPFLSQTARIRYVLLGFLVLFDLCNLYLWSVPIARAAHDREAQGLAEIGDRYDLRIEAPDFDIDWRRRYIKLAAEKMTKRHKTALFGDDLEFPLAADVDDLLNEALQGCIAVDDHRQDARSLSDFNQSLSSCHVAMAMAGHDQGADYLLWNTKALSLDLADGQVPF